MPWASQADTELHRRSSIAQRFGWHTGPHERFGIG